MNSKKQDSEYHRLISGITSKQSWPQFNKLVYYMPPSQQHKRKKAKVKSPLNMKSPKQNEVAHQDEVRLSRQQQLMQEIVGFCKP
jgi:hypothetical protein